MRYMYIRSLHGNFKTLDHTFLKFLTLHTREITVYNVLGIVNSHSSWTVDYTDVDFQ